MKDSAAPIVIPYPSKSIECQRHGAKRRICGGSSSGNRSIGRFYQRKRPGVDSGASLSIDDWKPGYLFKSAGFTLMTGTSVTAPFFTVTLSDFSRYPGPSCQTRNSFSPSGSLGSSNLPSAPVTTA